MALPFFYSDHIDAAQKIILLNEETSKHVVQVLRMQNGEQLQLTDGRGNVFTAEITDNNRKKCAVKIIATSNLQSPAFNITIAISLLKNANRFEWFLEKATELGVTDIVPLLCERTEKQSFKSERLRTIVISAMLQSQQCNMPVLHEPVKFKSFVENSTSVNKFIAHCEDENEKVQLNSKLLKNSDSRLILIGPEGDFTREEIALAKNNKFVPVALGNTRLRTETAGVVASTLLCLA